MKLLHWHPGLGDAFLCNGLVRVLVARGERLLIPVKACYMKPVRQMFSDLPVSFTDVAPEGMEEISFGGHAPEYDPHRWDESFYRQAGVPFIEKWRSFLLPFPMPAPVPVERFIHDDAGRGMVIPMEGHRPAQTDNIFDHLPHLLGAKEIHCIDSSFANLADLIPVRAKLFIHRYARGHACPIFGRQWTHVKEPPR